MPSHLEAALSYAKERKWPVFPIQIGGKRPLIFKGDGYKEATTDENTIRGWWQKWPRANIGIPCGESTFCVVDVDTKGGGIDSHNALCEKHGAFPATLVQITGNGGLHYCFRHDERIGNTASRIGPGIDTRGNGKGYIVVAPSTLGPGKDYSWDNPGAPIADVPDWVIDLLKPPEVKPSPPATTTPSTTHVAVDQGIEERARAYLRECEPAVQGAGGHSRLLWACTAMVHGYELSDADALRLLAEEYNPRCSPPWDLAKRSDLKEFSRKIQEGRREKRKPRGWLLVEMNLADEALLAHAREQADALIESAFPAAAEPIPFNRREADGLKDLPKSVLFPPGILGDLVGFINSTARSPQPLLALATGYAFCGALFGRKVRNEWDLRTNIYCLGVAESGAGKDHSRQVVKRLCTAAGVNEQLLGGEEVTSDSAIAACLERSKSVLVLWDEIGHMLASIMDRGASGHRRGIVPYLMRLTGSASGVF
ncbi:MAG TPA: bifunctional DNA primase/polymerase, partial [Thermoleophilia bacterium]|nr:bifunctional DNA primase/polymerase [Thermoleophilia bacterium]